MSTTEALRPDHSERVTHLALAIGRQLRLDEVQLDQLYRGGLLHDIGKVAVPPEILDKPGTLTAAEREIVERHPSVGYELLTALPGYADVLPIVRSHHERPDGAGMAHEQAVELMLAGNGTWLDATVLAAFLALDYARRKLELHQSVAARWPTPPRATILVA